MARWTEILVRHSGFVGVSRAGSPGKGQAQEVADKVRAGRSMGDRQADGQGNYTRAAALRDFVVAQLGGRKQDPGVAGGWVRILPVRRPPLTFRFRFPAAVSHATPKLSGLKLPRPFVSQRSVSRPGSAERFSGPTRCRLGCGPPRRLEVRRALLPETPLPRTSPRSSG